MPLNETGTGIGVATIVVARWETAFDEKQARAILNSETNDSQADNA